MAKLAVSKDVLKNFHKLPVKVQKRVSELIERFKNDPYDPAIGLHGLKGTMKDPKVRGADLPDGEGVEGGGFSSRLCPNVPPCVWTGAGW